MSTFNGEPYPGFFANHEAIAKAAHDATQAHCAVADSFAFENGEETKPEIGCMYMYDYAQYVYDGMSWVPIAAEKGPENPEEDLYVDSSVSLLGSPADGDIKLTVLGGDADAITSASIQNTTSFQISDGSDSYETIDMTQLVKDVASMKEMLHMLMGNKTVPAPEENLCDDPGYDETIAFMAKNLADDIDKEILSFCKEEAKIADNYDRAMGIL